MRFYKEFGHINIMSISRANSSSSTSSSSAPAWPSRDSSDARDEGGHERCLLLTTAAFVKVLELRLAHASTVLVKSRWLKGLDAVAIFLFVAVLLCAQSGSSTRATKDT